MPNIKFSFAILTWNRSKLLALCLSSLMNSIKNLQESEIIIMDNGSEDDTSLILSSYKNNPIFKIYRRDRNYGLNSYKKLLAKAKGKYVIMIDEDVIDFPDKVDEVFENYLNTFPDYGFVALDVIQNEFTNGAKPKNDFYADDTRNGLTIQRGPTGAWCSCYRRKDFNKVRLIFNILNISMRRSHDTTISFLFRNILKLKHGIIKGIKCFHACGPYYAKEYGYLDMQAEKYKVSGFVDLYKSYADYGKEDSVKNI